MKVVCSKSFQQCGALEALSTAVEKAGYKLGDEIQFALDVASSEFLIRKKENIFSEKVTGPSVILMRWLLSTKNW